MISRNRINKVLSVSVDTIDKVLGLLNKIKPLQDKLNKELAKRDDYATTLRVENGKFINYGNCILSESDEIRNSTPWKHWKFSAAIDKDNLNLEIADMFHFGPSIDLVADAFDVDKVCDCSYQSLVNNISDLLEGIEYIIDGNDEIELTDLSNIINHSINLSGVTLSMIFYKMKYNNNLITSDAIVVIRSLTIEIMLLSLFIHQLTFNTTIEESIEMISNTYISKNTLNKFRNNNGYNTGEYIKMWDGKEDNMVAMGIMSKHSNYTPEELYDALVIEYAKVIK